MKKIFAAVMIMAFGILSLSSVYAAAEKFGSVDVGKLFDQYEKTKEYSKSLEDKASSYEKERDVKLSEIKQMQDKLNLLSDAEKEKKQKEIDDLIKSAREFAMNRETDLKKEGDDRLKEVAKDIEDAVSEYAKKEGYTMVFNERVFVYSNKANDITSKVFELLQARNKKDKTAKKQ
ncbi:MAG TPA: OmpH family outer membrane protein [Candidatus Omnitrophota bacterium]|nr:OmpH family outer membrane protein [Candidatus Omnitrophota bacterium]